MASRPSLFLVLGFVVPPAILLACGSPFSATTGDGGASSSSGPSGPSGPSGSSVSGSSSSSGGSSNGSSGSASSSSGSSSGDAGACPTKCATDHLVGYGEFQKAELDACGCTANMACSTDCKATCGTTTMTPDVACGMCLQAQENMMMGSMCTMAAVMACSTQLDCATFVTCVEMCPMASAG